MKGSMNLPGWEKTSGSSSRTAKLNDEQVREIRRSTATHKELGQKYGMHPQAIYKVRARITYRDVK